MIINRTVTEDQERAGRTSLRVCGSIVGSERRERKKPK